MQDVVKKWGNSAAVRIPASVLEAAHVCLDQPVDVREEGGRIVIEPLQPVHYDLEPWWLASRRTTATSRSRRASRLAKKCGDAAGLRPGRW